MDIPIFKSYIAINIFILLLSNKKLNYSNFNNFFYIDDLFTTIELLKTYNYEPIIFTNIISYISSNNIYDVYDDFIFFRNDSKKLLHNYVISLINRMVTEEIFNKFLSLEKHNFISCCKIINLEDI